MVIIADSKYPLIINAEKFEEVREPKVFPATQVVKGPLELSQVLCLEKISDMVG